MSSPSPAHLLESHLGLTPRHAGLISARTFRSILVTVHHAQVLPWTWQETMPDDPYAAVLFPTSEGPDGSPPPHGRFVPPSPGESIEWRGTTDVTAVWVPVDTLPELLQDAPLRAFSLQPTRTVQAFRAFTLAVAHNSEDTSSVISEYAIERLIAEMVFGALVEVRSSDLPEPGQALLEERARSAMLLHREDPEFNISRLAAELHVSVRHLQRTFAKVGTTPGDALRRMRVEHAAALLRNPHCAVLTVEEIAGHAGFTSGLQLRRALRAEGMPSPTMMRPAG